MKIIVVDDEPIIADTLVNILEGEGHDALAVSHGESAIKGPNWCCRTLSSDHALRIETVG